MKKIIVIVVIVLAMLFLYNSTLSIEPLVEIESAEESTVNVDIKMVPEQPVAGEKVTLSIEFTNEDGTASSDLMNHHARKVHVVFMSKNLDTVGHVHPLDFGEVTPEVVESGKYSIEYTFPAGGEYIVGIDVMNMMGEFSKQYVINVEGEPSQAGFIKDLDTEKCFLGYAQQGHDRYVDTISATDSQTDCSTGYKVTFTPSVETIKAGEEVELHYTIQKNGEDVTDLSSFLDAALHLAVVPTTLSTLLHHHGLVGEMMEMGMDTHTHDEETDTDHYEEEIMDHEMEHESAPSSFGPYLVSEPIVFPEAGTYRIFSQTKHGENIIFMSFMVEVEK